MNLQWMKGFVGFRQKGTLLAVGFAVSGALGTAAAQQGYYDDGRHNSEPYISIYEDCDFRGTRRDIAVGEFRKMRELDFGNDRMSSIQVPSELEAIIYEHDDFRGDYARVNRDVRCFDRSWNNQVSSLRVEYAQGYDNQVNRDAGSRVYGGENQRRNAYEHDSSDRRDNSRQRNSRQQFDDRVTVANVAQVTFDNRVLKQIGDRKWQIADRRRGVSQYREVNRDKTSVFLKNEYNAERLKIDMRNNVVTMVSPRGEQNRYRISQRQARVAGFEPKPQRPQPVKPSDPNRRITSKCFDYFAYTDGGTGGLRFISKEGYSTFQKSGDRGRVCHTGVLPMEITKRDKNTNVYVKINGRVFSFVAGEKEDRLQNNWYRKHVKLVVGK